MAPNRESVCDHHRNPEPQACTERSSHQETFQRNERGDRGVESIRSSRTCVCRCHRDSPGQEMKRGQGGRSRPVRRAGFVVLFHSGRRGQPASSPCLWNFLMHESVASLEHYCQLEAKSHSVSASSSPFSTQTHIRLWVVEPTSHVKWGHWASPSHRLAPLLLPSPVIIFAFSLLKGYFSTSPPDPPSPLSLLVFPNF